MKGDAVRDAGVLQDGAFWRWVSRGWLSLLLVVLPLAFASPQPPGPASVLTEAGCNALVWLKTSSRPPNGPLGARIQDLLVHPITDAVWVAGEDGVARLGATGEFEAVLPGVAAESLAATESGVLVASERGVSWISDPPRATGSGYLVEAVDLTQEARGMVATHVVTYRERAWVLLVQQSDTERARVRLAELALGRGEMTPTLVKLQEVSLAIALRVDSNGLPLLQMVDETWETVDGKLSQADEAAARATRPLPCVELAVTTEPWRDRRGRWWVGTSEGLLVADPGIRPAAALPARNAGSVSGLDGETYQVSGRSMIRAAGQSWSLPDDMEQRRPTVEAFARVLAQMAEPSLAAFLARAGVDRASLPDRLDQLREVPENLLSTLGLDCLDWEAAWEIEFRDRLITRLEQTGQGARLLRDLGAQLAAEAGGADARNPAALEGPDRLLAELLARFGCEPIARSLNLPRQRLNLSRQSMALASVDDLLVVLPSADVGRRPAVFQSGVPIFNAGGGTIPSIPWGALSEGTHTVPVGEAAVAIGGGNAITVFPTGAAALPPLPVEPGNRVRLLAPGGALGAFIPPVAGVGDRDLDQLWIIAPAAGSIVQRGSGGQAGPAWVSIHRTRNDDVPTEGYADDLQADGDEFLVLTKEGVHRGVPGHWQRVALPGWSDVLAEGGFHDQRSVLHVAATGQAIVAVDPGQGGSRIWLRLERGGEFKLLDLRIGREIETVQVVSSGAMFLAGTGPEVWRLANGEVTRFAELPGASGGKLIGMVADEAAGELLVGCFQCNRGTLFTISLATGDVQRVLDFAGDKVGNGSNAMLRTRDGAVLFFAGANAFVREQGRVNPVPFRRPGSTRASPGSGSAPHGNAMVEDEDGRVWFLAPGGWGIIERDGPGWRGREFAREAASAWTGVGIGLLPDSRVFMVSERGTATIASRVDNRILRETSLAEDLASGQEGGGGESPVSVFAAPRQDLALTAACPLPDGVLVAQQGRLHFYSYAPRSWVEFEQPRDMVGDAWTDCAPLGAGAALLAGPGWASRLVANDQRSAAIDRVDPPAPQRGSERPGSDRERLHFARIAATREHIQATPARDAGPVLAVHANRVLRFRPEPKGWDVCAELPSKLRDQGAISRFLVDANGLWIVAGRSLWHRSAQARQHDRIAGGAAAPPTPDLACEAAAGTNWVRHDLTLFGLRPNAILDVAAFGGNRLVVLAENGLFELEQGQPGAPLRFLTVADGVPPTVTNVTAGRVGQERVAIFFDPMGLTAVRLPSRGGPAEVSRVRRLGLRHGSAGLQPNTVRWIQRGPANGAAELWVGFPGRLEIYRTRLPEEQAATPAATPIIERLDSMSDPDRLMSDAQGIDFVVGDNGDSAWVLVRLDDGHRFLRWDRTQQRLVSVAGHLLGGVSEARLEARPDSPMPLVRVTGLNGVDGLIDFSRYQRFDVRMDDYFFVRSLQVEVTSLNRRQGLSPAIGRSFWLPPDFWPWAVAPRRVHTDVVVSDGDQRIVATLLPDPTGTSTWLRLGIISVVVIALGWFALWQIRQHLRRREAFRVREIPWVVGSAIRDPERFVGRDAVVDQVCNGLAGTSFALLGEWRMGKSSLQSYLGWKLERLEDPAYRFFPVFIDLHGIAGGGDAAFWQLLGRRLADAAAQYRVPGAAIGSDIGQSYSDQDLLDDINRMVAALRALSSPREPRLVLQIDEISTADEYRYGTMLRLRSIFSYNDEVKVILSGRQLPHMSPSTATTSPWWNTLTSIQIEPFTLDEARQLIQSPLRPLRMEFSEAAVQRIHARAEGKPHEITKLCAAALLQYYKDGQFGRTIGVESVLGANDDIGAPQHNFDGKDSPNVHAQ